MSAIQLCADAGIPFHTWGWVYATNYEQAAREGELQGKKALELNSKCHWVNAEREWAGTSGAPFYPDPMGRMAEYLKAFRAVAPGIPLANCSMTSWSQPALKPIQVAIHKMFDLATPMCYSSGEQGGVKTMRLKWNRNWNLINSAGRPFAPVLGTGRVDPKSKKIATNLRAIAEQQKTQPADWICLFNGCVSSSVMMTK